jgi:hypothetical protein
MQFSRPADARTAGPPRVVETDDELRSLRQHLNDVVKGAAFKGSHRSGEFLQYIVEQAIAGRVDSMKERVIGVEFFGRSPSYDTGEDAIVRVTASEVRHRLLQHYGTCKSDSDFRITLPQGTYVPEIVRVPTVMTEQKDARGLGAVAHNVPGTERPEASQGHPIREPTASIARPVGSAGGTSSRSRAWFAAGVGLTLVNIVLAGGMFWMHWSAAAGSPRSVAPWSVFFSSPHLTHLVTSDPSLATVQDLCGNPISVSDYANHNYIPDTSGLPPETVQSCRLILSGDNVSNVDPGIAARIGALAQRASARIDVRAARNIELTDLKTDDNYILLGSPRSDPWSALFNDQLDFRFVYDKASKQEIIRNVRPRIHELPQYVPTALGGGTGQSFAIIAVVQNLDQDGQVMLLAGADAEGTEAASNFVTDLPRLSAALKSCGISRSATPSHFEPLLQLDTMAGSANRISMVACHALLGNAGH